MIKFLIVYPIDKNTSNNFEGDLSPPKPNFHEYKIIESNSAKEAWEKWPKVSFNRCVFYRLEG